MFLVERATYGYIKQIVIGGITTLTEKRFIFYLLLSLLALTVSTTHTVLKFYGYLTSYSLIISNFEAAVSLCLLISGGMALIIKRTLERIVETITILSFLLIGLGFYRYSIFFISVRLSISIGFYGWILILNIATFSAIRNFVIDWSERLASFREQKNVILFEIPIKIIAILSILGFIILGFGFLIGFGLSDLLASVSGLIAWLITVVMIVWWVKKSENNVFTSIIGFFFIFIVFHLVLCLWNGIGTGTGSLIIDAIIISAGTLYSVQWICRRLVPPNKQEKNKKRAVWEDGAVIALLGTTLGYHASALAILLGQNSRLLIYSFHQYSILLDAIIIVVCIMLFTTSLRFKNFVSKRL